MGRVAPNKCQHDVVGAFAVYRRVFDPQAHLTLVGGGTSPNYLAAVHRLIGELDLGDSVEILSGVGDAELLAHWAVADVFVCMSEHEGFCVPILEAMELGVPVVAYGAAAVPETLGGAGIVLDDKDPLEVAKAVDRACRPGTSPGPPDKGGPGEGHHFLPGQHVQGTAGRHRGLPRRLSRAPGGGRFPVEGHDAVGAGFPGVDGGALAAPGGTAPGAGRGRRADGRRASARASASPGGTSRAASPSTSLRAPQSPATTGVPAAMACSGGRPNPS